MKLFKKMQNKETELPSQPPKITLEQLIDELASQPPKAMEKIMTLAKARREYNQKLKSLQQSLEGSEPEEETPETIESTIEALKALDADDGSFTYIETEVTEKKKDKD